MRGWKGKALMAAAFGVAGLSFLFLFQGTQHHIGAAALLFSSGLYAADAIRDSVRGRDPSFEMRRQWLAELGKDLSHVPAGQMSNSGRIIVEAARDYER